MREKSVAMAYIEDRWWKDKRSPSTGERIRDGAGVPVRTKTPRFGTGLRYRVRFTDPDGDEHSKSFPDGQLALARKFKTKMENDLYAGIYISPRAGDISFADLSVTYRHGRSQDESSKVSLDSLFDNQILPFLGRKRIRNIDVAVVRQWKLWLAEHSHISINYQADAWMTASATPDAAVEARLIGTNPFRSSLLCPPRRVFHRVTPWPAAKLRAIKQALPDRYRIAVPLGAGLGLRPGEVFAFSPENIDRAKLTYNCDRQIVYCNGILAFKLPKGHKSRTIPMTRAIIRLIDDYTAAYPPIPVTLPWAEQDRILTRTVNLLITDANDRPWRGSTWGEHVWKPAFEQAEISYQRQQDGMHALRHFYASYLLTQGVTIKEIAAYLGHSSEAFTLKIYVHLTLTSYDRARLAIDTMFPPAPTRRRMAGNHGRRIKTAGLNRRRR
ncbi:tyrosine-type recombinase/integrase [Amycolatopsis sp. NPDC052450]|uniref:tyrosine-type recombinase/integrase n=1 Tax=Amycolatopsis sp. NPDC052450 TaxID=3363937 RepID=UPI0037C9D778